MISTTRSFQAWMWPFIFFLVAVTSSGCTLKLTSDYDEVIDRDSAALHKKLDAALVKMMAEPQAEKRKYQNYMDFYNDVLVDLNALKVRASAIHRNEITQEQILLLEQNLGLLILLHKGVMDSASLSEKQIERIRSEGISTTATESELTHPMNRSLIQPVRSLLDQHFGAIMAFELAKKRGDEPQKK